MGSLLSRPLILLSNLYAAYQSFKSLESQDTDDDKQWLTYWIVNAVFQSAEYFSDAFLSWLPAYSIGKLCVLVWMQHPRTRGALWIYNGLLRPYLKRNEKVIDERVEQVVGDVSKEIRRKLSDATLYVSEEIKNSETGKKMIQDATKYAELQAVKIVEKYASTVPKNSTNETGENK